jgi:hypothetical protein
LLADALALFTAEACAVAFAWALAVAFAVLLAVLCALALAVFLAVAEAVLLAVLCAVAAAFSDAADRCLVAAFVVLAAAFAEVFFFAALVVDLRDAVSVFTFVACEVEAFAFAAAWRAVTVLPQDIQPR